MTIKFFLKNNSNTNCFFYVRKVKNLNLLFPAKKGYKSLLFLQKSYESLVITFSSKKVVWSFWVGVGERGAVGGRGWGGGEDQEEDKEEDKDEEKY